MLNEARIQTFAVLLKAVASPLFQMELEKSGTTVDWAEVVRTIATVVPEQTVIPFGGAVSFPYQSPMPYSSVGGYLNSTAKPESFTTLCSAMTETGLLTPAAMPQADGMGDDSGLRGD